MDYTSVPPAITIQKKGRARSVKKEVPVIISCELSTAQKRELERCAKGEVSKNASWLSYVASLPWNDDIGVECEVSLGLRDLFHLLTLPGSEIVELPSDSEEEEEEIKPNFIDVEASEDEVENFKEKHSSPSSMEVEGAPKSKRPRDE